ncbi:MAG: hypothetical protein RIS64_2579 [Bacteroidota bacterium]|jgi:glycosyltransferase
MKISIITVTLNAGATIRRALESAKNQMGSFDLEHIIVDGMSADDTVSIIQTYPYIAKLIVEPDNGIFDAMNKGIQQATGTIIGILNADDVYYNSLILNEIHLVFKNNPLIDMVYGHVLYHAPSNPDWYVRYWQTEAFSTDFFEKGLMIPHTALFIRKSVYDKEGFYKIKYGVAADYEFMFRTLKINAYKAFFLNKLLVKMQAGGRSNNGLKTYWQITQAYKAIWNEHQLKYPFQLYYRRPFQKIMEVFNGLLLNTNHLHIKNKINNSIIDF